MRGAVGVLQVGMWLLASLTMEPSAMWGGRGFRSGKAALLHGADEWIVKWGDCLLLSLRFNGSGRREVCSWVTAWYMVARQGECAGVAWVWSRLLTSGACWAVGRIFLGIWGDDGCHPRLPCCVPGVQGNSACGLFAKHGRLMGQYQDHSMPVLHRGAAFWLFAWHFAAYTVYFRLRTAVLEARARRCTCLDDAAPLCVLGIPECLDLLRCFRVPRRCVCVRLYRWFGS